MNTTHAEKVINKKHLQATIGSIPVIGIKQKTEDTNNSITTPKRLKQTNYDTHSIISGPMGLVWKLGKQSSRRRQRK